MLNGISSEKSVDKLLKEILDSRDNVENSHKEKAEIFQYEVLSSQLKNSKNSSKQKFSEAIKLVDEKEEEINAEIEEWNLKVLKRHNPNILKIIDKASFAVLYLFDCNSQSWTKVGVEGTMFLFKDKNDDMGYTILNRISRASPWIKITGSNRDIPYNQDNMGKVIIHEGSLIMHKILNGSILGIWIFDDQVRQRILGKATKYLELFTANSSKPLMDELKYSDSNCYDMNNTYKTSRLKSSQICANLPKDNEHAKFAEKSTKEQFSTFDINNKERLTKSSADTLLMQAIGLFEENTLNIRTKASKKLKQIKQIALQSNKPISLIDDSLKSTKKKPKPTENSKKNSEIEELIYRDSSKLVDMNLEEISLEDKFVNTSGTFENTKIEVPKKKNLRKIDLNDLFNS